MRKRIFPLLAAILLLCMSVTATAHDVPDLSRDGSISITMRKGETVVSGGSLTLYPVGEISEDDGSYSFVPAGVFKNCVEAFDDLDSAKLASDLAAFAKDNAEGRTLQVGADGKAVFRGVVPGLYLVVQETAAEGWNCAAPFLISIPNMEDGVYVYDVEASPKVELTPAPEKPKEPTPSKPADPTLPQTGQLNWPVPLLTIAGLCLFAAGWAMRFGGKKERYEK